MSRGRQPIDTDRTALMGKFKRGFEGLVLNGDRKTVEPCEDHVLIAPDRPWRDTLA